MARSMLKLKTESFSKEALGKKVKSYRNLNNLTQQELADNLGMSKNHISEIERGLSSTTMDTLYKIITFFDITFDDLLKDFLEVYDESLSQTDELIDSIINELDTFSEKDLKRYSQIVSYFVDEENG